jgi:restriction system protein
MNSPSPIPDSRRPDARVVPQPAGATRRQRAVAIVDLIRDATLSLVQRFLNPREPAARELAGAAKAASHELGGAGTATPQDRLIAARRHLTDLLSTYEHFLLQHRMRQWQKDDAEARAVRTVGQRASVGQLGYRSCPGPETYAEWLEQSDPGVAANTIICLIHQVIYLLDRQINLLRQGFRPDPATEPTPKEIKAGPVPSCPVCGVPMIARRARRGPSAGVGFWGCTAYPRCRGIRDGEKKAADSRPRP